MLQRTQSKKQMNSLINDLIYTFFQNFEYKADLANNCTESGQINHSRSNRIALGHVIIGVWGILYTNQLQKNMNERKPPLLVTSPIVAQSICALDSCYEKWSRFATLKKIGVPCFLSKSRLQKTRSLLYKKRRDSLVSSLFE